MRTAGPPAQTSAGSAQSSRCCGVAILNRSASTWQLVVAIGGLYLTAVGTVLGIFALRGSHASQREAHEALSIAAWTQAKDWGDYCKGLNTSVQNLTEDCKSAIDTPLRPPLRTLVDREVQRINSWLACHSANECSETQGTPGLQHVTSLITTTYVVAAVIFVALWLIYVAVNQRQRLTLMGSRDPENGSDDTLPSTSQRSVPESSEHDFTASLPPINPLETQIPSNSAVEVRNLLRRHKPYEATIFITPSQGREARSLSFQAFLDTGSSSCLMSESAKQRLDCPQMLETKGTPKIIHLLGSEVEVLGKTPLSFQIDGRTYRDTFFVLPTGALDKSFEIILGRDFIAKNNLLRKASWVRELEES